MALQTMEAPGGAGLQVLCPNCSRMHDADEYAPTCKRCGAQMKAEEPKPVEMNKVPDRA